MPRKKNASKKNNSVNATLKLVQEIEMDLMEIPTQLANQLDKEISSLTTKATKLESSINKLNNQAEKKAKSNTKAAKKAVAKCLKEMAVLTKEWQEITNSIDTLKSKQAKLIALRKHLGQFEKEWSKQAKAIKAAKKVKSKTSKKTRSEERRVWK